MPRELQSCVGAERSRYRSVHVHLYRASSWAGLLDGMHEVSHMLLATNHCSTCISCMRMINSRSLLAFCYCKRHELAAF